MGGHTTFPPTQLQSELRTNHRCLNHRGIQHHEGQDFSNTTPGNHFFVYVLPKLIDAMPHITSVPLFFRLHHTDRDVVSTGEQHDHPLNWQQGSQPDHCIVGCPGVMPRASQGQAVFGCRFPYPFSVDGQGWYREYMHRKRTHD